jgi:hypothetical protein
MLAETLSQVLCGLTMLLWILIANLSQSDESENRAQWLMVCLSVTTAISLMWLDWQEGTIWGSSNLMKPLALLCLAFAFLARLNIKGKNLSQGMNPHQIMKQNKLANEDE